MDDVIELVRPHGASTAIDVGGGMTTPLRWIPGRNLCVDPLAEHYARLTSLPLEGVDYLAGGGESLPVERETIDLVICTNCIDHTDDPAAIVAEVRRVLRPGGWFWFTCEEHEIGAKRNAGHPHALNRADIRGLLNGLDVVLDWEEPWRGVLRYLVGSEPAPTFELGFLARKPEVANDE
ncbi:MAG: class I SAM-dependent methyltransferase [Sandaracinaceae bacterium]|nr:class I SAM-dependent methyltransferase [Sandaracinaceae bacterium]